MYISHALGLIANAKQRQRLVEYSLKCLRGTGRETYTYYIGNYLIS